VTLLASGRGVSPLTAGRVRSPCSRSRWSSVPRRAAPRVRLRLRMSVQSPNLHRARVMKARIVRRSASTTIRSFHQHQCGITKRLDVHAPGKQD